MSNGYMTLFGAHRSRGARALLGATVALLALFLVSSGALGARGTRVAKRSYGYPYRNAPDCPEFGPSSRGCVLDRWSFYQGQCTSWVAYRLNQRSKLPFKNDFKGQHFGSATNWGNAARRARIAVNGTPAVGAVAWYSYGHVAYVEQVSPTVVVSEMNFDYHNGFRRIKIRPGKHWPTGFIHFKDLKTAAPDAPEPSQDAPAPTSPADTPPPTNTSPPSSSPPTSGPSNRLSNDGRLLASKNEYLRSADGRYRFVMQQDSNLVLYGPSGRALWPPTRLAAERRKLECRGTATL